jgi:molybdate transport system substrate-binding protein
MTHGVGALAVAVALSLLSMACGPVIPAASTAGAPPGSGRTGDVELTIFAAASLRMAAGLIAEAYPLQFPGTTITVTTDSSTTLATQVELGAQADVFLSADIANPARLVAGSHGEGSPVPFATNPLVVVVGAGNPLGIGDALGLARPGLRVIAAGPDVPITRYATQLVQLLGRLPGAPPGFVAAYEANIVSREDNVAAVMARMELGVGDAAIVYQSDVTQSALEQLALPDRVTVRATYAGVVLRSAAHPEAARAFLDWLAGPAGQEILARASLGPP